MINDTLLILEDFVKELHRMEPPTVPYDRLVLCQS